ncbi:glycosyltransferase [Aeromonas veronii]|uniref:glycosyltransferase n=1 Tax=Aeromonas veronii TaxID=654 RepID=UPI0018F10D9A|nr:glycosyltransferase [Aeromonas veronii]MBJ7591783.1 glycosyltransferase [Aeromonas veronii]
MLLSVITINYNDIDGLKCTSQSVRDFSASCKYDVEYIVIDGGSIDGSERYLSDIVSENEFHNVKVISESDNGIYDAMNKGLGLVSEKSDYVIFMNAGDIFNTKAGEVLNNTLMTEVIEVFGIDSKSKNGDLINIRRIKTVTDIEKWPCFPHQATFISTPYHRAFKYTEKYRILSDYDFFCRSYISGVGIRLHSEIISVFAQGGVSNSAKHTKAFIREIMAIQCHYFGGYNERLILTLRVKRLISMLPYADFIEKTIRKLILN